MNKIIQRFPLLIIALAVLASNFSLLIDSYSMKWDLAEQYLPWRHFLSRSILSGDVPFWNPFQLGGYPTYLDPQSGFWYYPAWLISLVGPYTMQLIEWEYCSLLIAAGWGFFKLCKHLQLNHHSGIATGIAYALSGFMVGNAQHLTWIIAAAYLPWIILLYLKWKDNPTWKSTFTFVLIFYCFCTGSYPAFSLTVFYLLFFHFSIHFFKSRNKTQAFRWLLILIAGVLISLAPIIYAFSTESIYFSRGAGVSIQKALQHPFSLWSLSSTVFPFASLSNESFFNTDLSMRNAYMGIFIFPLLIVWLIRKKTQESLILAILAIAFLCVAVGDQLPFRSLLYHYIPGFNLFRFPALFRLFTIFFTLLLCAHILQQIQQPIERTIRKFLIGVSVAFLLTFIFSLMKFGWMWFPVFNLVKLSTAIENASFGSLLNFQFSLQCVFFCLLTFFLIKDKLNYVILIVVLDLFIATRLNQMGTVLYPIKTRQVDQMIINAKGNYEHPNYVTQNQLIDQSYSVRWPLNWNLNNYYGQIAIDGYNPFVLNTFNHLSDANNRDSVWQYPWYHLSQPAVSLTKSSLVDSTDIRSIQLQKFSPNSYVWNIGPGSATSLVIAQNPYKHWTAKLNDENIALKPIHYAQQSIDIVNQTEAVISMRFFPKTLAKMMVVQVLFLASITLFLIISFIKNFNFIQKSNRKAS